jgi:hypothetical protein
MLGWINYRWSDYGIPFERLTDTFFTLPAMPLRGHEYSALYGNKYGLINAEFRFPLFAAVIPGAIPILPLYNITGAFFIDAGTAWGFDIAQTFVNDNNQIVSVDINPKELDFRIGEDAVRYYDFDQNDFVDQPVEGNRTGAINYVDGDVLIGSGFGLRTIVFGLPLRWDMAWAYGRGGFQPNPIHYFSIGIDF